MKTEIKTKQPLTELEKEIFQEVTECINMAMQTDEIAENIASKFSLSKRSAIGHLGKIAEKGYIKSESYRDHSIGKITQFVII